MATTPLVWLITGSASGFGQCLVKSVLARGDKVVATARRLESLKHLEGTSGVSIRELDVAAGPEAITKIVTEIAAIHGRIDVVVNNAGLGYAGLLEETGSALLRKQLDVNYFGVMDVTAAVLPFMRAQKSGTVVIIGSRSAWKTDISGLGAYVASKAAVHALAETLTVELAPLGLRVLLVAPGAFPTGIYGQGFPDRPNPIPEYDQLRALSQSRFNSISGTEKGDPQKAMNAVVDVVRGEGVARGHPWPAMLVLGEDAERDFRLKTTRILEELDEWRDVVRGVNLDT
ncbi:hypothetical protein FB45DRAFT_928782 [Roridomyces roridus]|uniref:Uncharacterized protein n=1 Tax=Roridomyces roridus TaxID=1738132 RepID=A0AAD7BHS4_9AGAR|nr:hypothetical protein FB45DRAFT_928782 [Roridomyces roridus]